MCHVELNGARVEFDFQKSIFNVKNNFLSVEEKVFCQRIFPLLNTSILKWDNKYIYTFKDGL